MAHRERIGMVATVAAFSLAGCASAIVHPTSRATTTPPRSPTSTLTAPASTAPYPDGAAFWDAQQGLLVVTPACEGGDNPCQGGIIERTRDAGKTWQVVDRVSLSLSAVAVAGSGVAWVSEARSGCGAGPGSCAVSTLLLAPDGGTTWTDVASGRPVTSVAPASASTAWAIAGLAGDSDAGPTLVHSTDGGQTWQQRGDPCNHMFGVAPSAVSFVGSLADGACAPAKRLRTCSLKRCSQPSMAEPAGSSSRTHASDQRPVN